ICAEWAGGGLPAWLANPAIVGHPLPRLRSDDPAYLARVDAWWDVLLPRVARWTVARGGPIAAVQVENELGFVGPERAYMKHLARRAAALLGPDVVLFTVDPPDKLAAGALKGPSTLTTVDFGPSANIGA
ncbi:beta-galactosidase, partial [Salmonella enterica]|uniref:beta-galactosidase n=1 Tax=Salmonella enterica TaxID=28901 RepID=UPI0035242E12